MLKLLFWLAVAALLYLGVVFWITDRVDACAASQTVSVGEAPVVNEVTCLP